MRGRLPVMPSRSPSDAQLAPRQSLSVMDAQPVASRSRTARIRIPGKHIPARVIPPGLFARVIDAVHDAVAVIGDEQGPIRRDDHVDRAAPGVLALQPALRE